MSTNAAAIHIVPPPPAPRNPYRVKLRTIMEEEGFETIEEMLCELGADSVMPACCTEGCEVEPDGRCEHGCPSILLAAGLI